MKKLVVLAVAALLLPAVAHAAESDRLDKAAQVLRDMAAAPDRDVPQNIWERAQCVAVIPDLKKAGFIIGGEYGKGVLSCRSGDGWSAPAFMRLAKGSWGAQIGAEEVD